MSFTQAVSAVPLFTFPTFSGGDWFDSAGTTFAAGTHKVNADGLPVVDEDGAFVLVAYGGTVYDDASVPKTGISAAITLTVWDVSNDAEVTPSAISESATVPGSYYATFTAEIGDEYACRWDIPTADTPVMMSDVGASESAFQRLAEQVPGSGAVIVLPAPSSSDVTAAGLLVLTPGLVPVVGAVVHVRISRVGSSTGATGRAYSAHDEWTSNGDGLAAGDIPRGAGPIIEYAIAGQAPWTRHECTDVDTVTLPSLTAY